MGFSLFLQRELSRRWLIPFLRQNTPYSMKLYTRHKPCFHCVTSVYTRPLSTNLRSDWVRNEWPTIRTWPGSVDVPEKNNKEYLDVQSIETASKILEYMWTPGAVKRANENPEFVVYALRELVFKQLVLLERHDSYRSWLQRHLRVAVSQLSTVEVRLNKTIENSDKYLPHFHELLNNSVDSLSANNAAEALALLQLLGEPINSKLCTKLYLKCQVHLNELDLRTGLTMMSYTIGVLSPFIRDFEMLKHISKTFKKLLENKEDFFKSMDEVDAASLLTVVLEATRNTITPEAVKFIKEFVATDLFRNNFNLMSEFIPFLSNINYRANKCDETRGMVEEQLFVISGIMKKYKGHCTSHGLLKMTKDRRFGVSRDVSSLACFERAYEILERPTEELEIKDVLNIGFAILAPKDITVSDKYFRKLLQLLRERNTEHLQTVGVGHFYQFCVMFGLLEHSPPGLLECLQAQVRDSLEKGMLPIESPIYYSLVDEDEYEIMSSNTYNHRYWATRAMTESVLRLTAIHRRFNEPIPHDVLESLMYYIDNSTPKQATKLITRLVQIMVDFYHRANLDPETAIILYRQFKVLHSHMVKKLEREMDTWPFVRLLICMKYLAKSMCQTKGNSFSLLYRLVERLKQLPSLTWEEKVRIKGVFMINNYFSSDYLEIFTRDVLEFSEKYDLEFTGYFLKRLMTVLWMFSYVPTRHTELLSLIKRYLQYCNETGNYLAFVYTLQRAMFLGDFDDQLKDLFTVETLRAVDNYMKGLASASWRNELKVSLALINREVAILRPELKIPWFCKQELLNNDPKPWLFEHVIEPKLLMAQVKYYLQDILPKPFKMYVQENVVTEYCHVIPFVMALETSGNVRRPIPSTSAASFDEAKLEWVCVLPVGYAQNDKEVLRHISASFIRQLQCLGYRTIALKSNEWRLFDDEEKYSFLHSEIFLPRETDKMGKAENLLVRHTISLEKNNVPHMILPKEKQQEAWKSSHKKLFERPSYLFS